MPNKKTKPKNKRALKVGKRLSPVKPLSTWSRENGSVGNQP
jgi:hypothetical protein